MFQFLWCLFFFHLHCASVPLHPTALRTLVNSNVSIQKQQILIHQQNSIREQRKAIKKREALKEKKPPKIEIFELEQKFNAYCIRYRVSGQPSPTKVWHLNGTALDFGRFEGVKDKSYSSLNANGTRYAKKGTTKDAMKITDDGQDGCLEIAAKSQFLSGLYQLTVKNELGEASETKQVVLFVHPEQKASVELDELAKGNLADPLKYEKSNENNRKLRNEQSNDKFNESSKDSPIILSVSINFTVLMLSLLFTSLFFYLACVRYLKYQSKKRSSQKSRVVRQGQMSLDLIRFVSFVDNPNYLAQKKQYLKIKGINHVESERIQLVEYLGEGEFGRVFLGTLETPDASEKTLVAVKVLKAAHKDEMSEAFKEEAEVLSQIDHENIVKFFGISVGSLG